MDEKLRLSISNNVDQYANVTRQFRYDAGERGFSAEKHLIITSGSDGMSIATKSSDGWIRLDEKMVKEMIKELSQIVKLTKDAQKDASSFWAATNGACDKLKEIRAMWSRK